jgi:hypothetical protein
MTETEHIGTQSISKTYRKLAGQCGHIYITISFREDKPNRIDYIKIQGCTKHNDCGGSWAESIADLLSFSIKRIRNKHEAELIIKALKHHRCNRIAPNIDHTTSCADAIAKVLQEELKIEEEEKET